MTSTVDVKDGSRGRPVSKAKVSYEIFFSLLYSICCAIIILLYKMHQAAGTSKHLAFVHEIRISLPQGPASIIDFEDTSLTIIVTVYVEICL